MDLLVTYDIDTTTNAGERRLHRVAKVCEQFGVRVQYSVFECRLSPTALARLVIALEDVMVPGLDSVRIYRFQGTIRDARTSLGRPPPHEPGDPWIV